MLERLKVKCPLIVTPNREGGEASFPAGPFDPDRFRGRIPSDEEFRAGLGCAFRRRNRVPNGGRFAERRRERSQYHPNTAAQRQLAARKNCVFPAMGESFAGSVAH